jgi:hypothetical protein
MDTDVAVQVAPEVLDQGQRSVLAVLNAIQTRSARVEGELSTRIDAQHRMAQCLVSGQTVAPSRGPCQPRSPCPGRDAESGCHSCCLDHVGESGGPRPKEKASTTCRPVHSTVRWSVTRKCTTCRIALVPRLLGRFVAV